MANADLFISYRRADTARVKPLVEVLTARGLHVWFDQKEIENFQDFSEKIRAGLTHAKALLVWYSKIYPESRACQWELTAAFLVAQREGDPCRRVLVVNPEANESHILPGSLRRENLPKAPAMEDTAALAPLADSVVAQVNGISGAFGDIRPLALPRCYGHQLLPAERFYGRYTDLWQVHTLLHEGSDAVITADAPAVPAHVQGMGGVGKSLLAEEYALRFGSAYPGGIFWLRALGKDGESKVPEQLEAERQRQETDFALKWGVAIEGLKPAEIRAAFERKLDESKLPFLWVVDDLPSGLDAHAFRNWLAPHPLGKTLFTTRSREYGNLSKSLSLDVLNEEDALKLLTSRREPEGEAELEAARGIAQDLGYHPLALEVAGAALASLAGLQSFAGYRATLANSEQDELELGQKFVDVLPTGHETSIAATFLRSIRQLGEEGRDFLMLAASLAAAPIPARLVADTFEIVDEIEKPVALRKAASAFKQTERLSLAKVEDVKSGTRVVYALVARTMRFESDWSERREMLRHAVITALNHVLPQAVDIRKHADIALDVLHARELIQRMEDEETVALLGWIGHYERLRGNFHAANRFWNQELTLNRRLLGDEHPVTLRSMNNLALSLADQGIFEEARLLQEQAVALHSCQFGEDHPNTLISMSNLAATLYFQGKYAKAQVLQEQILRLQCQYLGEEDPDTLTTRNNLAETLHAQRKFKEAHALHEENLKLCHRIFGEEDPKTLASMNNVAEMFRVQGNLNATYIWQKKALVLVCKILGDEHPDTLRLKGNLASTLSAMGNFNDARTLQEQVLAAHLRKFGNKNPDTSTSAWNLLHTLIILTDYASIRNTMVRTVFLTL